jgi:hypothetical protein
VLSGPTLGQASLVTGLAAVLLAVGSQLAEMRLARRTIAQELEDVSAVPPEPPEPPAK